MITCIAQIPLQRIGKNLYPCHIGNVGTWCHNDGGDWWATLSVKVFEEINLKFLPRNKEDHRDAVACIVSHSNNGDRVYIVLPIILLPIPDSVSYQLFRYFTSHDTIFIKV